MPRITQMRPQVRAISPLLAENPQRRDSLAERVGFELTGDFVADQKAI